MTPLDLIHRLTWADLPSDVKHQTKRCLLDLIGIAAGAHHTKLGQIIRDITPEIYGGSAPMLFDARTASPAGVALAGAMTIDALDGHDTYFPAKGHIGCPLFPAALALAHQAGTDGRDFLTTIAMGYEFGARAAEAQHGTVPDYHTSGSWGAVTAAAAGARLMGLSRDQTRHAMGIAEYYAPRSQMMRCIDFPTMLKDGSGWGSMTGVSAVQMAAKGFTGAPAITVEDAPDYWTDLGQDWRILKQSFKAYPVCHWALAPVAGVLALARAHDLTAHQVDHIEVTTFHESVCLATSRPTTTEQAQYSTSFPCAVALVRGTITPQDLDGPSLKDPEILRLSEGLVMAESDYANDNFPAARLAKVTLVLKDGTRAEGDYMSPAWAHTDPPSDAELRDKYHALADPVLGKSRAEAIETALANLATTPLSALTELLFQPIN
ncbi:MAG: 2-methylcitrate dehydratase PrpD [Paracoccaceae bacterium]|jgi:2-methylcitrate dehydratase PrpD